MKLHAFLIGLLGCFAVANASTIPNEQFNTILINPGTPGDCIKGTMICVTLIHRHCVKRCDDRNSWLLIDLCAEDQICDAKPSPHCVHDSLDVRGQSTSVATHEKLIAPLTILNPPDNCPEGAIKCSVLGRPYRNREALLRCSLGSWNTFSVCNPKDVCVSNPAPHCVHNSLYARDEPASELDGASLPRGAALTEGTDPINTALAESTDSELDEGTAAMAGNQAPELPCTKCRKFKEHCIKNCNHQSCINSCTVAMRNWVVEDGKHGRYRGTCHYYCPYLG
ncbi:hypothetical protein EJ02DRAFT_460113 [Clathrospora elynae]|uniref:Uncharacterized protein n=1 Tax=Clathrospora elynae TaxID=706981 RepID=A0A6A5S892_9PLEO|nr:hypothetical protein EJ02DRAFT_460113 [Clathrospora elynae]